MKLNKDLVANKKNLLYYSFFTIQFLTVIALINAGKFIYIKDVLFNTAVSFLYVFIESRYGIYISNYVRGCLIILISVHNFAGKYLDFYLTSTLFDKGLHIFGTYCTVLFFFSIINQLMEISFRAKMNKFVFLVLLGVSIGAVFEILEFAVDVFLKPPIPNQPGLADTDLDMIADLLGALAAAFHVTYKDLELQTQVKG